MSNNDLRSSFRITLSSNGLFILFSAEMGAFSYYGMRALLVLYMTTETMGDSRGPGLGWSSQEASLYGWYTMLVAYVMSIPGSMIADKLLGKKKLF
jgi:POT family proton-dependent oligopeptide transporter